MPIKASHLAIYDFETTSLDTSIAQPVEIACKIYNERSLEPIPGAEFKMMCRPTVEVSEETLNITGISRVEIEKASPISIVYPKFVEFLLKYNPEQNKWTAPIAVGHNIDRYDMIIHQNMMSMFCKKNKFSFQEMHTIDLMDLARLYFHNTNEVSGYGLTALRNFFGIPVEGAHRAMKDVDDTAWIVTKLLRFQRQICDKYMNKMKNSYKNDLILNA